MVLCEGQAHAHAQLHLCEQWVHAHAARTSGTVSAGTRHSPKRGYDHQHLLLIWVEQLTPVPTTHISGALHMRQPATHVAQLQIGHGSVVGHSPQVGDPNLQDMFHIFCNFFQWGEAYIDRALVQNYVKSFKYCNSLSWLCGVEIHICRWMLALAL